MDHIGYAVRMVQNLIIGRHGVSLRIVRTPHAVITGYQYQMSTFIKTPTGMGVS